ncbi:PREDICTED: folylpolyglutamate synthase, mitochondrial-like [Priapulus caudatus]|uniref:Folylpolyglutamate synthase n=1 Tax=Priapulus caudatus TaxID=37621 RepID=A0ABM1ERN0_PRICU|nr:PREDICTED: folylpolyglutamate synthase, mitochondrial-like [Priapulus caudatus]
MHTKGRYEDAIRCLNSLQTNAETLARIRKEGGRDVQRNIPDMITFAQRAGITLDALDKLNVIHVSGTKGKGSTCAFTESILRQYGYKTGLFTSPHLVETRERIRINGLPIEKKLFASYFFEVYNRLINTKNQHDPEVGMPAYFRFLTLMSLYVFVEQKVDVAILECGIGGTYDCTNIVRKPVVCGVSSLGIDHVSLLGDTVEKIAWHKAGIFKDDVAAVTVPQPAGPMQVLSERARELGARLTLAPDIHTYDRERAPPQLGLAGDMQLWNASLALQLCKVWLEARHQGCGDRRGVGGQRQNQVNGTRDKVQTAPTFPITTEFSEGLKNCFWPGRAQTLRRSRVTYFLDGAHTASSMETCARWFKAAAKEEASRHKGSVCNVLMFNSGGDRLPSSLLAPIAHCHFDCVIFCPNRVNLAMDPSSDQSNFTVSADSVMSRCHEHKNVYLKLIARRDLAALRPDPPPPGADGGAPCSPEQSEDGVTTAIFPCIAHALRWVVGERDAHILV